MKVQLTNAAGSLVQMLREECVLVGTPTVSANGVIGYEGSLQRVLEALDRQVDRARPDAQSPRSPNPTPDSQTNPRSPDPQSPRSEISLDMFSESTACLASANPCILPKLPRGFGGLVGVETCVWFNAFIGRVYRDVAHSKYFYGWFCQKLTDVLNKGKRALVVCALVCALGDGNGCM